MNFWRVSRWAGVLGCVIVAGCGGYGGGGGDGASSSGAQARSMEEHFTRNVQPGLDFCRTCHVPGAAADVENGRDFMLSSNKSQDLANLKASWERLGGNNPTSRLLLMASGQETPHTGGTPWPVGSASYKNMDILLQCFGDPAGCSALLAGGVDGAALLPLLADGHRGGHAWSRYCEGTADTAVLPPDPRSLVQPGVNAGKAVYFNAYYKNCHVNAGPEDAAPKTCGDWRGRIERGGLLMKGNGAQGGGAAFLGDFAGASAVPGMYMTTDAYNQMWRSWGLTQRPEGYDQLIASRWGVVLGREPNPYPLPGEDPNATNGGSGQLPTALTQLREADGRWSGRIAGTCHMCHSGQVGIPGEAGLPGAIYGSNSLSDIGVLGRDVLMAGYAGFGPVGPLFTQVRGLGNITNFQVFNAISLAVAPDNLLNYLLMQNSGSTGSEDPPVWWNYGHRPLKFFDGGMSSDAQRIVLSADAPIGAGKSVEQALAWIELHDQDAAAWILDLRAPKYPEPVDTALAEQGAILFHSKDLFALPANAGRERPKGGNGSCASCHGAYSPRFVHDKNYLETPELEGIAGYIVPRNLIGTDPQRVDGNDQEVAQTFEKDWFGYPEQAGTDNDCGDQNLDRIRGDRENGYLAPPLYGVWATAPYFHNGSVPNAWEVLKSSDRKPLWRRQSAPNDTGLDVVTGFDPSFQRAYDKQKLGWKYEEIACDVAGAMPFVACDPTDPNANPLLDQVLSAIYANGGLAWNVPNLLQIPLTNAQVEQRKIYSTKVYSQSNAGHDFADALTDQERRALIEYLKTL